MKKTLIVLLIALAVVSLFVSCDSNVKEPTTYTVTLKYDEETNESFKVLEGEKFVLPESKGDKAISSYTDGETTYTAGQRIAVKKDMSLTATFAAEPTPTPTPIPSEKTYFSVVAISKDLVVDSQIIESGKKYKLPVAPTGTGFKGWQVGEDTTLKTAETEIEITANTTVKAVWEAEPVKEYFTVVVISKDSVVETKYLEKDTEYALPAAPTGTGFNGWKVGDDTELKTAGTKIKITADTTVKADWTADPAPVYYSLTVISKEEVKESKAVVSGTKYTLPTNSETGFLKWSVNGTETAAGTEITVSANTTVKAVFEAETPVSYYAVVVLNKDTLVESKAVAGNSTYTLPSAPSGEGTFNGWLVEDSTVPSATGTTITINNDTVIKADWETVAVVTVAAPTFYKDGTQISDGFKISNKKTVTIKAEEGAQVYYTVDNSNPTTASTNGTTVLFEANVEKTVVIKAIAVKNGVSSAVSYLVLNVVNPPQLPTISVLPDINIIDISGVPSGATVYFYIRIGDTPTGLPGPEDCDYSTVSVNTILISDYTKGVTSGQLSVLAVAYKDGVESELYSYYSDGPVSLGGN